MEDGGEADPGEVGQVGVSHPFGMRIDGDKRPDERGEDEENVESGQVIILETELDGRESEIEDEVEQEGQDDLEVHLFPEE